MQTFKEVNPGDRIIARSDRSFTVYTEDMAGEKTFVGPASRDLRITSFTAPKGAIGVVMEYDADAQYELTVMPNRYQKADGESLVKELEHDQPRDIRDLIANTIADLMKRQGHLDGEPESVEEANDFGIHDDEWGDERWALDHEAKLLQEEYLQAASEATESPPEPVAPEPVEDPAPDSQEKTAATG